MSYSASIDPSTELLARERPGHEAGPNLPYEARSSTRVCENALIKFVAADAAAAAVNIARLSSLGTLSQEAM